MFDLLSSVPYVLRQLLHTVQNWTIGDSVRVLDHTHRTLNPSVLRFVGRNPQEITQWSPVNIQPMHATNNMYTITVHEGPLWLEQGTYGVL